MLSNSVEIAYAVELVGPFFKAESPPDSLQRKFSGLSD
jgi:hypothetical protein